MAVKSFLGCIDLKVGCITIAVIRMVISIFLLIAIFFLFFVLQHAMKIYSENDIDEDATTGAVIIFVITLLILIPIICINIVFSYWFILGATSNDPTRIARMKYYLYIELINIFLILLRFEKSSLPAALLEFYLFVCSNSLYRELLKSSQQNDAVNPTEITVMNLENVSSSPPPQYSSCEQGMQPQNGAGMYQTINEKDMQPQNAAGMYPKLNELGMQPQNGAGIDPKMNEKHVQPQNAAGMDPKMNENYVQPQNTAAMDQKMSEKDNP